MGRKGRNKGNDQRHTLGTFAGVFTPSVLTILGIILFLRTGYVVGSAGLGKALIILGIANVIAVLTSVSLSAIATNLKVKGGGHYYLISRTLGLEFGGAIGVVLFLAQAVSIAFYCIGFGEVLAASGFLAERAVSPRVIAAAAVAFLFVLAWLGADWANRFQYVVMVLLVAALGSFFAGGIDQWNTQTLAANWTAPGEGPSFWVLFALFFPAVTGFTAGVSMSGDLKNPGKSLPLGTFLAVGVSILVYFGAVVLFAGALPNAELAADFDAMNRLARYGWLIDAGVIAATLSSAMASFLGAPRILQSLAADRIFPFLHPFAKGAGPTGNPRRAVAVAAGIAFLTIFLGNLNLIAPVVTMFFLITYGLLNYATFYEARTASPSFRPSFKWFDKRLSLLGFAACLLVMLIIDPTAGIVAISLLFAIMQYLRRTADPARWADSRRGHHLQRVRENLLAAAEAPQHPRDWRPQILAFAEDPDRRPRLLRLASWLEGGSGLTTAVQLLEGKDLLLSKRKKEAEAALSKDLREHNPAAFSLVLTTRDANIAVHTLLQAHGIGPLRTNTVLLNWRDPENAGTARFREVLLGKQLRTLHRLGGNIVMLHASRQGWARLEEDEEEKKRLGILWSDDATGRMMLLLAYLMKRAEAWKGAELQLLAFPTEMDREEQQTKLASLLEEARIEASICILPDREGGSFVEAAGDLCFLFLPFRFRAGGAMSLPFVDDPDRLLSRLPPAVVVAAGEDIDLGAEPEEGAAADLAAARDRRDKWVKLAEETEGKAEAADEKCPEEMEKLRRKAASARAKATDAENALKEMESGGESPEESPQEGH
ncbi:MAG: amino acid permease [Verrucomicrobia bacterium]|jgi:amino acid transporter|nr:amino acid permease [Verrucomicrobiota bacterium]